MTIEFTNFTVDMVNIYVGHCLYNLNFSVKKLGVAVNILLIILNLPFSYGILHFHI
jgi:hypothetical protein